MSATVEAVIIVGMILVLGALYQIARHLERIETLLRDRFFPDPDDLLDPDDNGEDQQR